MIALLCPTRGRPTQYKRMEDSVKATAKDVHVAIYRGTNGDDDYAGLKYPIDCPTVYMWNDLASRAGKHKLCMLASDDIIFTIPGWDKALLDHYNALENKIHVYAFQDSRDPNGTPHIIVTREYIDAMGYFVPPIFVHWFVDTWTVEIAKANNCFTHLKDFLLVHEKPSDKGQADETHLRIRRNGWFERDKFVNDKCKVFLEFEKERLKGNIMASKMGGVIGDTEVLFHVTVCKQGMMQ